MKRSSSRVLAVLLVVAGVTPVAAQTTDTEQQAATDVLRQIDQLEQHLEPSRLAERLVQQKDASRDAILADVKQVWTSRMQDLSDWIGHHPEVGFTETQAVDTLTQVLRGYGFDVQTGVAGLKTAFVASWTSPAGAEGPVLGLIGEYDALRGTAGPFHGDQHNAQTPVAVAAAVALKGYMTQHRVPGRIVLYGTPAEEMSPPSKTVMWKAGVFKGADILVRSHSTSQTSRDRAGFGVCCLNIDAVKYTFHGRPSHQLSSWNGRNALEAAVAFYTSVDRLRSSWRPEARIQGIIPEGGSAPNVVPDRAVVDYYIRYPDEVYLEHIADMMSAAAKGAAAATGTTVDIDRYGEYRDGISLGTLEELKFAYEKKLGAPALVPEPQRPSGYEETGWVSRDVPGVGVTVHSSTYPNHTYGMLEDDFKPVGHDGFVLDAQIEAAILYDFLTDAKFRAAVAQEHQTLAGLLQRYHAELQKTYAAELGTATSQH